MLGSRNWNFSGIVISNPMRKKQSPFLYSNNMPVRSAYSFVNTAEAAFSSLVSYSPSKNKQYITTKKNNKSISLPAIDENTG